MKKKMVCWALMFVLLASMSTAVYGETVKSDKNWQVIFTQEKNMQVTPENLDFSDDIYGLQPGDTAVIQLSLKNQNSGETDWYMTNQVIRSLEDSVTTANGGAYTYILTYTDKNGAEKTLFSSDTVGGETVGSAGEGLHEATDALKDYFYLDTLASGQGSAVILQVTLDGETQGNGYQKTLADLKMNFAVELREADSNRKPASIVKTGDDTNLIPYFIAAGVCGVLLLALALYGVSSRKKGNKEVR